MYDCVLIGRLVTPVGILDAGWIAITDGKIGALGTGTAPEARDYVDYGGRYILPGVVDGQTHAGSQIGFPGLGPTSKYAVAGGVTTIVDMPYDEPDPVTNAKLLQAKAEAVATYAVCDVALYGTVPATPDPEDIAALIAGGVCAFKISSFEAHPWRFPRIDNAATLALLLLLKDTGLPLGLHNEDQEIVRAETARLRAQGKIGPEFHSPSRPEVAELAATVNFLELGAASGAHAHIVHISTPDGFARVMDYAARGVRASAEMCIHYLYFDADADMAKLGGRLKVNPPIRANRRDALWQVLEVGGCSFVSSDHSAWPLEKKSGPTIFDDAAGMPGLDTILPAFLTAASRRYGINRALEMSAEWLAARPARFFGLTTKGELAPGKDADIVVIEPIETIHDCSMTPSGVGWSAYEGEVFAAKIVATYVRGVMVWDGTTITARPGLGQYIRRTEAAQSLS